MGRRVSLWPIFPSAHGRGYAGRGPRKVSQRCCSAAGSLIEGNYASGTKESGGAETGNTFDQLVILLITTKYGFSPIRWARRKSCAVVRVGRGRKNAGKKWEIQASPLRTTGSPTSNDNFLRQAAERFSVPAHPGAKPPHWERTRSGCRIHVEIKG